VHFIGEIPPDAIGNFLICLDVFAFPSAAETFGLAAVEAAQAGIPVVANTLPVLHEVLQVDGVPCALFVDVSDTHAFVRAVERLLLDRDFAQQLSLLGQRLSERYSLHAMVDDYRRLINGEQSRRSRASIAATASGEVT
jgi:glycosyltransferase involved in cell wall biosynthesis